VRYAGNYMIVFVAAVPSSVAPIPLVRKIFGT
jgi:hypothetical protein